MKYRLETKIVENSWGNTFNTYLIVEEANILHYKEFLHIFELNTEYSTNYHTFGRNSSRNKTFDDSNYEDGYFVSLFDFVAMTKDSFTYLLCSESENFEKEILKYIQNNLEM